MAAETWNLVGDIGGTNARFGINRGPRGDQQSVATYKVADYPDFSDVLRHLMQDIQRMGLAEGTPTAACFAVAGPPHLETVSFTNSSWHFTCDTIHQETGVNHVHIINDFAAVARALPGISDSELVQIGGGQRDNSAPKVAMGAGTGLGVGALIHDSHNHPMVVAGEGDTSISPRLPTSKPRYCNTYDRATVGYRLNGCAVAMALLICIKP